MTLSAIGSTLAAHTVLAAAENGPLLADTATAVAEDPPTLAACHPWTTPPTDRALDGWRGWAVPA